MQPNNPTNPTTPPQPGSEPLPSRSAENAPPQPTQFAPQSAESTPPQMTQPAQPIQPSPQPTQPVNPGSQTPPASNNPIPQPTQPDLIAEAKKTVDQISKLTKGTLSKKHIWILAAAGIVTLLAVIIAIVQSIRVAYIQSQMATMSQELDEKTQLVTKYAAQLGLDVSQSNNPNLRPPVKPDTSDDKDDNKTDNKNDNQNETKPSENYIASADYIYIGEWGMKIKIPKGLKNVSYRFENTIYADDPKYTFSGEQIETLCVSGILDEMNYTPETFMILQNSAGFGCLFRHLGELNRPITSAQTVGQKDGYYYYYTRSQAELSTNEAEQEQESKISTLIEQMLTNPDNLTKF